MANNGNFERSPENSGTGPEEAIARDPQFQQQVQRLYQLTVYSRWLLVGLLWLTIAPLCLWHLRSEFALWRDYFTWTAVRFAIAYNRLASFGLILCIGMTVSTLVWQSRSLLWEISAADRRRLEKQVLRIRRKGRSHPLWKWICG